MCEKHLYSITRPCTHVTYVPPIQATHYLTPRWLTIQWASTNPSYPLFNPPVADNSMGMNKTDRWAFTCQLKQYIFNRPNSRMAIYHLLGLELSNQFEIWAMPHLHWGPYLNSVFFFIGKKGTITSSTEQMIQVAN